jgi:hypothetical protein
MHLTKQLDILLVWLRCWIGKTLNLLGIPGPVQNCEYSSRVTRAYVSVRIGELFTVVSVNGLDIYFHRLTGRIDGVGFSLVSDCREVSGQESSDLGEPPSG